MNICKVIDVQCWWQLSAVRTDENVGWFVIGCQETKVLVWQPG